MKWILNFLFCQSQRVVMSSEREGGGASPKVQLHRLVTHLVGGAGGDANTISSHYRSGLQLLTSSSSHAQPGQETVLVEKMVKKLVRAGKDRDAAEISRLHSKLMSSGKEILRNRPSILALLYSLSEVSRGKENVPQYFTGQNTLNTPVVSLRTSRSVTGLSAEPGYHPPLPPRPRSRPSSLHEASPAPAPPVPDRTETDGGRERPSDAPPSEEALVRELLYVFQVSGERERDESNVLTAGDRRVDDQVKGWKLPAE